MKKDSVPRIIAGAASAPRHRRFARVRPWAYTFPMQVLRHGKKSAVKFVTPSGVTGVVATDVTPAMMSAMKRKLERDLRRGGHLPPAKRTTSTKTAAQSS